MVVVSSNNDNGVLLENVDKFFVTDVVSEMIRYVLSGTQLCLLTIV